MLDNHYTDRALVQLYDVLNASRTDTDFYFSLAGAAPVRILDIGCGTGGLACEYAAAGHEVTGLDPAAEMLRVAQGRPDGERVIWIEGDTEFATLAGEFDLIVMTGHVFQVFLTDADTLAVLKTVRAYLAPEGRLAFGSRNPLVRSWEAWTPARTRREVDVENIGIVRLWTEVEEVSGDTVRFTHHYMFAAGEEERTSTSTIRFPRREHIDRLLGEAGLVTDVRYGFWDKRPYTDESTEVITVARRA